MAPRSRLLLLARSYAHACSSQGQNLQPAAGRLKVGANFKGGCNHETIRFRSTIEKKLAEQDLKLVGLEGELGLLKGRVAAEEKLYRQKELNDDKALKCAIDEVKFSVVKGALASVGLTAAVGSVVANMSRITEWLSGKGSV